MGNLILTIVMDSEGMGLTTSFDSPITFTGDNVTVDWGDNTTQVTYTSGTLSHTYANDGEYMITITGDITGINDYAFQTISEIVIPSSITNIGSYVFGNGAIEKVTFESTTPPTLGNDSLNLDAEYGFTIRVPTGSLSAYQNAENFPQSDWVNYNLYTIEEYTPQNSSNSSTETPSVIGNLYTHLRQLHKYWFYDKDEMDTDYVALNDTTGLLKNDGTVDTNTYLTSTDISGKANTTDIRPVGFSGSYTDLTGVPSTFTPTAHTHTTSEVSDNTAHTNLNTTANSTQSEINTAIDTRIGALLDVGLILIVDSLPSASSSTMNKLYLVEESTSGTNDAYEIFVTVRTGTSGNYVYTWEKLDTTRIDLSGLSSDTHTHGALSRDGKIGTDANNLIVTGASGALTHTDYIGNIDFTGAIGSDSGKVAVTTTDGVVTVSSWELELDNLVQDLISVASASVTPTGSTVTINVEIQEDFFEGVNGLGCFLCDVNGTYTTSNDIPNNVLYKDLTPTGVQLGADNHYSSTSGYDMQFVLDNVDDGTYYMIIAGYDNNGDPVFSEEPYSNTGLNFALYIADNLESTPEGTFQVPGTNHDEDVITITVSSNGTNTWYVLSDY